MAMLTWLADVLRGAGLPVFEVPGWRSRGHGQMSDLRGVLTHHTAGAASGNYPSLVVVRDGRPGLAGPLAQLGLARDGTWFVIAAGQAWHAGTGFVSWCGRDNGNAHLIGIEAESTGRGDWTHDQLNAYPRGVAALLKRLGLPVTRAIGHKEWAPGRKIDPADWPGDMNGFRATVAQFLTGQEDDLKPDERDWLHQLWKVAGEFYAETGIGFGKGLADLWRNLRLGDEATRRPPGTLANAIQSVHAQVFTDTDYGPALVRRPVADVDEAALAAELGPLLPDVLTQLSDEDVKRIAQASADERDKRERERLAS